MIDLTNPLADEVHVFEVKNLKNHVEKLPEGTLFDVNGIRLFDVNGIPLEEGD